MIRMDISSKIAGYQMEAIGGGSSKNTYTANKKGSGYDEVILSTEGKSYDIAKVMEIHEKGFHEIPSREESDYYWAARRSDPELDARLYEQDKAEALAFVSQVQTILMKVMAGKALTAEEQELVDSDPYLQQAIGRK